MPICIVALESQKEANALMAQLHNASTPLAKCALIRPKESKASLSNNEDIDSKQLQPVAIDAIPLLNPNLSKQLRQKNMALLLMPFGFIAGITFTQMTGLTTFADLGFGFLDERLLGGLVGMVSGWMGSYVGAASVKYKNVEDLTSLQKLSAQGLWLMLLETPLEVELPWNLLQELEPKEIVRLIDQ